MAGPSPNHAEQALAAARALEAVASALKAAARRNTTDAKTLNDVYAQASVLTQKARDIAYDVAHKAADEIASGEDIKTIVEATKDLEQRVQALADAQAIVETSLKIAEAAALVVTAIFDPTHATSGAAVSAIGDIAS